MAKKLLFLLLILPMLFVTWCSKSSSWDCKDVTSYDNNWNNDMKCTSSDWTVKYTSYEWAKILQNQ